MMNTSTNRAEKPSRYDGLCRSERSALYSPESYIVEQTGPTEFLLTCPAAGGAQMVAWDCYGRGFNLRSNVGNEYLVMLGCCCCGDKERALAQSRLCKHEAACAAIELFLDRGTQPERIEVATEQQKAQATVAATFAGAW